MKEIKICIEKMEYVDILLQKVGILEDYDKAYRKQIYLVIFISGVNMISLGINWSFSHFMCLRCPFFARIMLAIKFQYPVTIMFISDFTFINIVRYAN